MAKIPMKNLAISAGFGLVDLGLELNPISISGWDAKDVVRLGTAVGSYAANFMGYFPDVTEVLFYSSLPLAIKSAYSIVKSYTGGGGTKARVRSYGLTVSPPPTGKKLEFIGIK